MCDVNECQQSIPYYPYRGTIDWSSIPIESKNKISFALNEMSGWYDEAYSYLDNVSIFNMKYWRDHFKFKIKDEDIYKYRKCKHAYYLKGQVSPSKRLCDYSHYECEGVWTCENYCPADRMTKRILKKHPPKPIRCREF